jgi:DNA processing protein
MNQQIKELMPADFPPLLREIADPPKRLFAKGELPDENAKMLCIVGSRKYTEYGRAAVEKLVDGLRGAPITIVSGLALGIDGIAHRAALKAGLKTLAVPGSGLDESVIYPRAHLNLAKEIIASGGCLLSEFEPKFHATAWSFPQRNRIMAGLSHAVLVIEAELKSGTLITSKLATEYNRDVLTIPGSIFSRASEGPHMLLKLGAAPITSSEDIVRALGLEHAISESAPATRAIPFPLSPDETRIVEILRTPIARDELMTELSHFGLDTSRSNIILSAMELKGIITESLGEIRLN